MFDDDDFPINSKKDTEWISKFCNGLREKGLHKTVLWKINCRPDEVDVENFSLMKKNGLFHVFLGIEDGTDSGLKKLNKHTTVERTKKSISILKKLKIEFDYGFMLFQPETTFESLKENLEFLTYLCSDGYTPLTFLKLLPLYETKVEKELLSSGRLKLINGNQDYDFLEKSMNDYYNFIMGCFSEWLINKNGVGSISHWARNYFTVYFHYFDINSEIKKFHRKIRKTISESNIFLLSIMKELASFFETRQYLNDATLLKNYSKEIKIRHDYFKNQIEYIMGDFLQTVYFQYRPLS
jgi:radical SAM superfamily enzyme YgiQ (UPF0313 family)